MKSITCSLLASSLIGCSAFYNPIIKRGTTSSSVFSIIPDESATGETKRGKNSEARIGIDRNVELEAQAEIRVEHRGGLESQAEILVEPNVEKAAEQTFADEVEAEINAKYNDEVQIGVLGSISITDDIVPTSEPIEKFHDLKNVSTMDQVEEEVVNVPVVETASIAKKKKKKKRKKLTIEQIRAFEKAAERSVEGTMEAAVEKIVERPVGQTTERMEEEALVEFSSTVKKEADTKIAKEELIDNPKHFTMPSQEGSGRPAVRDTSATSIGAKTNEKHNVESQIRSPSHDASPKSAPTGQVDAPSNSISMQEANESLFVETAPTAPKKKKKKKLTIEEIRAIDKSAELSVEGPMEAAVEKSVEKSVEIAMEKMFELKEEEALANFSSKAEKEAGAIFLKEGSVSVVDIAPGHVEMPSSEVSGELSTQDISLLIRSGIEPMTKKTKQNISPEQIRAIEREAERSVESAMESMVEKSVEVAVEKIVEQQVEGRVAENIFASSILKKLNSLKIIESRDELCHRSLLEARFKFDALERQAAVERLAVHDELCHRSLLEARLNFDAMEHQSVLKKLAACDESRHRSLLEARIKFDALEHQTAMKRLAVHDDLCHRWLLEARIKFDTQTAMKRLADRDELCHRSLLEARIEFDALEHQAAMKRLAACDELCHRRILEARIEFDAMEHHAAITRLAARDELCHRSLLEARIKFDDMEHQAAITRLAARDELCHRSLLEAHMKFDVMEHQAAITRLAARNEVHHRSLLEARMMFDVMEHQAAITRLAARAERCQRDLLKARIHIGSIDVERKRSKKAFHFHENLLRSQLIMATRPKPLSAAEEALLLVKKYNIQPQSISNDGHSDGLEKMTNERGSSAEDIATSNATIECISDMTDKKREEDETLNDKQVIDLVSAISADVNAICNEEVIETKEKNTSNINCEPIDESFTDEEVLNLLTKISAEVDTVCNERVIGIGPSEIKKSMRLPTKTDKQGLNTDSVAKTLQEHSITTDDLMEHISGNMDSTEKLQRQNLEEGLISIASERKKRARQRANLAKEKLAQTMKSIEAMKNKLKSGTI